MGLWDWVDTGSDLDTFGFGEEWDWLEKYEYAMPGSYSIVCGPNMSAFIGEGRHSHVYGDDFKFVFDYEALLDSLFGLNPTLRAMMSSVAGGLVWGVAGNTDFVFGGHNEVRYGEISSIKRASTTTVTGSNFLSRILSAETEIEGFDANTSAGDAGKQKAIDTSAGIAAGLFSAVMILADLGAEITVKILTVTGGHGPMDSGDVDAGPEGLTSLIRTLEWFVDGHLAGLVMAIEKVAAKSRQALTDVELGEQRMDSELATAKEAVLNSANAAVATTKATLLGFDESAMAGLTRAEQDTYIAERNVAAALKKAEQALDQIVAMGAGFVPAGDVDGDINHQSLSGWNVAASDTIQMASDNNITLNAGDSENPSLDSGVFSVTAINSLSLDCHSLAKVDMNYSGIFDESGTVTISALGEDGNLELVGGNVIDGARGNFNTDGLSLQFGVDEVGPRIDMDETGCTIRVGPLVGGAQIKLTAVSILLQVGTNQFEISEEGIAELVGAVTRTMTAEGHDLTAASTILNVGVEGITDTSPIKESEVEAGNSNNFVLDEVVIDGVSVESVTMKTISE